MALERADLLRQRRLGHVEPLGRPGEVQLPGHRDEVPQAAQVHIHNERLSQEVLDRQRGWEDPQPGENEHVPIPAMLDMTVAAAVFPAGGVWLAGRPYGAGDLFEHPPGVVVTGSWLTVKEQMAGGYAIELARPGYRALTFDFAGWGDSGGEPRHVESPASKIADIGAAAAYRSSRSFVAPGGVPYSASAPAPSTRWPWSRRGAPIRSFAAVAGWFHETSTVAPFYGGRTGVEVRLQRADAAIDRFLTTGEVVTVPAYPPGDD